MGFDLVAHVEDAPLSALFDVFYLHQMSHYDNSFDYHGKKRANHVDEKKTADHSEKCCD